jgi:peptide/nickel transport system substrate-binding protein
MLSSRALFHRAALAAVVSLALIGSTAAQTRGGRVTLGVEPDIVGFDPLVVGVYGIGQSAAAALLFDTLTRLDENHKAQPKLALSWSSTPDFKTWTFKLRPDVKFQDGSPFNAAAVAFNTERWLDPANHCRCAFFLTNIARVEAVDELTVAFHLKAPSVALPVLIGTTTVVNVIHSPKAIQELGDTYNRHPVGTGPFRVKSWQNGVGVVLERNPDYWNPGHPYLDEVVIRTLPDAPARFASVLSGETDIIWHDEADDIVAAQKNAAVKVREYAGSGAQVYAFNTKVPPFDDVRVRQALRYALDLQAYADAQWAGLWHPAKDPYGPGSWVQCKDAGALPYDPDKAKALLAAYGKPVAFKMVATTTTRGRAISQIFQEFWKAAGAQITIDQVDVTTLVAKAFRRDFQLIGWAIADFPDPDPQMYADFYTGSPLNLAGYSNPEVDRLLDEARGTADQEQRSHDYCEIAKILNRDVPWFWTVDNHYFSIAKPQLQGVPDEFSGVIDLSDAWWDRK